MTAEDFKEYLESIKDTTELQEIENFLKISRQKGEINFDKWYNYLRIQHPRTDIREYGIPDYNHFKDFFEAYRKKESRTEFDTRGLIDLSKTLYMRQPVLYASGKGEFTDSYCLFPDRSIYILKIPLHYFPNKSEIVDSACAYNPVIATGIAKELGIETSENILGVRRDGQIRILSKYFLKPNEELVNFYKPEESKEFAMQGEEIAEVDEKISDIFKELDKSLTLRNYPKDQIEKAKLDFLKQEFLAKLIGLNDQKWDNTGLIISNEGGKRSVHMAPMFDYDFSFQVAEDLDLRVRKADNGKGDIASFIEQYRYYPGFLDFVEKSVNTLDMGKVYNNIYKETGIKYFSNYKENSRLALKYTNIVNKNLDIAKSLLKTYEREDMGEK